MRSILYDHQACSFDQLGGALSRSGNGHNAVGITVNDQRRNINVAKSSRSQRRKISRFPSPSVLLAPGTHFGKSVDGLLTGEERKERCSPTVTTQHEFAV